MTNLSDRRLEVSEAAWRVIVREGLDRASIRAIAQELGSTTGVVTHYFRNKDELMLFALNRVIENTIGSMQAQMQGYDGWERFERMVLAPLPLEEKDKVGWQIWVAFLGYAIGRARLMDEHRRRYADLRELIKKEMSALQTAQLVREIDLELEANALIALIDGIGIGFVIHPRHFTPKQQQYLVQRYVNSLLAVPDPLLQK